jgi:hypothetical protein
MRAANAPSPLLIGSSAGKTMPADGDQFLLWLMLLVGIIRPIQAVIRHETWGVEATVGLLMTALAARALLVDAWVGWRHRRTLR